MKSIKLLKAMGNIKDDFIEEAADTIKNGDEDFQDAVEATVPKRRSRLFPVFSCAAVLAIAAAVIIIANVVILNNTPYINRLLSSHGGAIKTEIVSVKHLDNVFDTNAPEYIKEMKENITDRFLNMEHISSDKVPPMSQQEEEEYVLFFYYPSNEFTRVFLYQNVYYIIEPDNTTFGCQGGSEEYSQILELLDNYAALLKKELKITAELDGYKAEQKIEYMAFILNVTFPDGETASVKTELADYGEFDHQIQMSASPETEIFKISYNDNTEYIVMQKVSYEEDIKKVIFLRCDEKSHELLPYNKPYKHEEAFGSYDYFDNYYDDTHEGGDDGEPVYSADFVYEYDIAVCPVSNEFTQGEEGNVFYDVKLGNKLGFNMEQHIISPVEYLSWEREFTDVEYSDIQEYYTAEKLNLSQTAKINGVIDGDLLYYFEYEEIPNTINFTKRIIKENMVTGEKQTILEEISEHVAWYNLICVQNGYLYYIYSLGGTIRVPGGGIWKINLNDNTPEFVYYPETLYDCYSYAIDNGFYFYCIYSDCNEAYFFDTSDDSVTKVLESVIERLFCPYKNGIIYSIDHAVYYRGDDDLYSIETMENGDKKLFEFEKTASDWSWYSITSNEHIVVLLPYDDEYIDYYWTNSSAAMIYDDKEGLKPLGKMKQTAAMLTEKGGNDLVIIGVSIYDARNGVFVSLPYYPHDDPPQEDRYLMQLNYSGGKIYYMIQRVNFMGTPYDGETEFYRLTRK